MLFGCRNEFLVLLLEEALTKAFITIG